MRKKNFHIVYIPENIDLEAVLHLHPVNIANAKDYLAVIMDRIHYVPAHRKDSNLVDENGFVRLSSTILQSWCDNYRPLMQWLIDRNIIEERSSYSNNTKNPYSKGYKFSSYYSVNLKEYQVTLGILVKKLQGKVRFKKKASPRLKPSNLSELYADVNISSTYRQEAQKHLDFLKSFMNNKLSIDSTNATKWLENLMATEETNYAGEQMFKYNQRKLIVDKIKSGEFYFTVDDTTGRLHTNLTSLKKELRNFLTYDGKSLSSLDLKNSQPLLSITLLDYGLYISNNMEDRIRIYQNQDVISFDFYTMLGNLVENLQYHRDVEYYKELVSSGNFYEFFGEQMILDGIVSSTISKLELRKHSKLSLMKVLFSKNKAINNKKNGKAIRLFAKLFPNVYKIFSHLKMYEHSTLACILQNLEAEIFLHKISQEIYQTYPTLPIFTVHDSIATVSEAVIAVEPIIEEHLQNVLGFKPNLSTEHWYTSEQEETPIQAIDSGYGYSDDELTQPFYNLKEASKLFGMGRTTFTKKLRELGILVSNGAVKNKPKDELILNDCFIFRKTVKNRDLVVYTPLVTKKGIEYLKSILS